MSKNKVTVKAEWDMKLIEKILKDGGREAFKEGTAILLDKANDIVPVDTGALRNSGGTDYDETGGHVYYDIDYADVVHERPSSGSKWLEKTVNSSGEEVLKAMQKGLSKEM